MDDMSAIHLPDQILGMLNCSMEMGFNMCSDLLTGNLLRTLAATKPGGRFLEIGTGTGISACWLLDGMDSASKLISVDCDPTCSEVARRFLGSDARLEMHVADGAEFISSLAGQTFDLVFADSWPSKYNKLDDTLQLVAQGGFYVVDDMLPQDNWSADHSASADALLQYLERQDHFHIAKMNWSSGIIICTKKAELKL